MAPARVPAAFLGYGSPINTLERNRDTEAWRAFGAAVPRPRAILMVWAHWYINATAMPRPRTIHDFYGFRRHCSTSSTGRRRRQLGIRAAHGRSWCPPSRRRMFRSCSCRSTPLGGPVASGDGAKLTALRERGVPIFGSGDVVHNLGAMDRRALDDGVPWAGRFNSRAIEITTTRPDDVSALVRDADFARVASMPEHFLLLLYIAGFGAQFGAPLQVGGWLRV